MLSLLNLLGTLPKLPLLPRHLPLPLLTPHVPWRLRPRRRLLSAHLRGLR